MVREVVSLHDYWPRGIERPDERGEGVFQASLEGLRRLKADERTASIPVIMLTTETDFLKRSQCRALGCSEFLNKPIVKEALGSAIRRWLVK